MSALMNCIAVKLAFEKSHQTKTGVLVAALFLILNNYSSSGVCRILR